MKKKDSLFEEIKDDFRIEKVKAGEGNRIRPVECKNCCSGT